MGSVQASQKQHSYVIPQSAMNTSTYSGDNQSLYAPSTTSNKASFSSRFGSLVNLPLLSRTKSSNTDSIRTSSCSPHRLATPAESTSGGRREPRDAVESIPSNKPPVVTFADLAYRYGAPNASQSGRL